VQEIHKRSEPPAEPSKEFYAVSKPKSVKEEPPTPPEEDNDIDILRSLENLW
jgi:hypothetical protein